MANILFSNNASSLLAATIGPGDTSILLTSGFGALFPSPSGSTYFLATLVNTNGNIEIVKCTARAGDVLTVVRAQEGTTAQSWTQNVTRVELRLTKGIMEEFVQKNGDTMAGALNMAGQQIQAARLTGATVIVGGQTVGTAIRGAENVSSNEIAVPGDGTRATAGGSPIMVQGDSVATLMPIGSIILWHGALGSIPAGWQLCDGTNGTPDLRDRFVRGAGGAFGLGVTGGSATAAGSTDAGGDHTHGGTTGSHSLTEAQIPSHRHRLLASTGGGISASGTVTDGHGLLADYSIGHADNGYIDASASHPAKPWVEGTGGGGGHTHTIPASGTHTHTFSAISVIPPFTAIYYIKKVS